MITAIATAYGRGPASGPTAVTCSHLPIYHIAGVITGGWNPLANGGALVHPAPQFTAKSTVDAIRLEGVTFMVLVPTMIGLLLEDPSLPPPEQMSIQNVSLGASTILYTDVEKCYEHLGAKRVITSYAMTEGLMMTRGHLPREPTDAAINGIQRIAAGTRLKICAPNSNEPVPRGEPGEVHQGGASTIRGYLGKESDNFYWDDDGQWCKTGDQAIMHPDGGVQITGRYKDLIIRGGVNISPQSIEGVISKILHMEAHVVGMPDSIAGEVPVAIVRDSDVGKSSLQKLREPIVRELGPRFALEKFISLSELDLKEFPKTSTGKIRKVDLQAVVRKYAQARAGSGGNSKGAETSDRPTIDRVIEVWVDVAGLDPDDVTPETSVLDIADSLVLARYATTIRQVFGRPFTLADMEKQHRLIDQAVLLDERAGGDAANVDLISDREGPPLASDMVHVEDDAELAAQTRVRCEKVLEPMGFNWDDVQDVSVPSEWLQSWVKSRETSDRFRAAYVSTEADVSKFAVAFEETLRRNDSLRAISVPAGDGSDLTVILRHSEKWSSKVLTISQTPVKTLKDLERLIPGDFKLNHGLAQVVIAHVEETNSAGCCLMTLHTTFDAFSLNTVRNDLNHLLNEKKPKIHVPYKLWMDHLYNQRDSAQAKAAIKYNVKRMKGLSTKRAALWPPQRTPVWQRGCDRGLHITPEGEVTTADDKKQRPLLDGKMSIGTRGLRRDTQPQDLAILTTQHRIPAPIIIKAALVLLCTRLTRQSDALFTQTFAMRDHWPFIDEWMSRRLPSPLEVTGPSLSRIAEIIPVDKHQNVLEWMQRMRSEQDTLVKHAHAPYRHVFDQLNKNSETVPDNTESVAEVKPQISNGIEPRSDDTPKGEPFPSLPEDESVQDKSGHRKQSRSISHQRQKNSLSMYRQRSATTNRLPENRPRQTIQEQEKHLPEARDGAVMESIRKRINFQWLPIFANDKKVKSQIRIVSSSHFNEVGLAVKAGMLEDQQTLWLKMEWDDGNIRQSEVKEWIDEMISYVNVLGEEKNWDKTVGELYSAVGL